MTRKWNYPSLSSEEQRLGAELARRFANCAPVADLLVQRGITTIDAAEKFFHPSLRDLHDPFLMPQMDIAVERLNRAMGSKEKIMVYGDYDVDGTTAVALVYRYLQNYYSELDFYIPTRYDDGYGISLQSIDMLAEQGVSLVIILDCGIKAIDEIKYAKERGIDFIICDHHMPDDELPPAAAILNPKLEGSTYPCPHLSGCGVGYKFMQAFSISNGIATAELECMLDLVAVSIAADIVPMIDENRVLAYMGLKRLNSNPNMGLRAIIRTCGLGGKEITINDVVFKIGPRINASGRMQSGREAVELLVARDSKEAARRSIEIDQYNKDRKELDKRITEEANAILEARGEMHSPKKSIVIYNKDWHKGIIGIVASRLTELYYKPSVVLTLSNGLATGSSRSVPGLRYLQGRGIDPRPARKLRRPHLRRGAVAARRKHTRVYAPLRGICVRQHTARADDTSNRHRRLPVVCRHHPRVCVDTPPVQPLRARQPQTDILHAPCQGLRHKQTRRAQPRAYQTRTCRRHVGARNQRHRLQHGLVFRAHPCRGTVQHLLHNRGEQPPECLVATATACQTNTFERGL